MYLYKGLLVIVLGTMVYSKLASPRLFHESAASKSQIKFAEENNYDQTGRGAKEYQGAYKTYKTLEEALIGYLDDSDTKLPLSERAKAYNKYIYNPITQNTEQIEFVTPDYYSRVGVRTQSDQDRRTELPSLDYSTYKIINENNLINAHNVKKYRPFRPIALKLDEPVTRINHQIASGDAGALNVDTNQEDPHYTFSYGVHDRMTGDSKSVHESRTGDAVQGYYTVMDPDGHQRTVSYSADDKNGFKAVVQRTPANAAPF